MSYSSVFKSLGFGLITALFLLLLNGGFVRLLAEVRQVQLIGDLLIMKLVSLAFLSTFLMLVFSATLTTLTTLFLSKDLSIFMHAPLSFRSVFMFKSLQTVVFSSWMVILTLSPFLAAYRQIYRLGASFVLFLTLTMVPFVLIACGIGIALGLLLMRWMPTRRARDILIFLATLIGCGLYVLIRLMEPEKLIKADNFEILMQYINLLEAPTAPYLPSWWLTSAVTAFLSGRTAEMISTGALLAVVAIALGALLLWAAERFYYAGWTASQEGQRRDKKTPLGNEWAFIPPLPPPIKALLGKDSLLFFRDTNQWAQLMIVLALMAFYLISVSKIPMDTPYLKNLISFLNIGMISFVLSAIGLRFVFPAISLEGRSWWVLRSAPIETGRIVLIKFLTGAVPLALCGLLMAGASSFLLRVDRFFLLLNVSTVAVMSLTLAALGTGLGALFPRFHVENINQIETSPGGMLYMVFSLFYIGLTLSLEALIVRPYYFRLIQSPQSVPLTLPGSFWGLFLVFNGILVAISLFFGQRHLGRMDA